MPLEQRALGQLILDFSIYPRTQVDAVHTKAIRHAIEAGEDLPPIVAEASTLRIVDGFHRYSAYKQLHGMGFELEVDLRDYESEADLWAASLSYNTGHGKALTFYEKAAAIVKAEKLGITKGDVAKVLRIPESRISEIIKGRIAHQNGDTIVLKRTVQHMAGNTITAEQAEANTHYGGLNQLFYIRQVTMLIETGMLDSENGNVRTALAALREALQRTALAA